MLCRFGLISFTEGASFLVLNPLLQPTVEIFASRVVDNFITIYQTKVIQNKHQENTIQ